MSYYLRRISFALSQTPHRWRRLIGPLPPAVRSPLLRPLERLFLLLDLCFVFDVYELLSNLLSIHSRRIMDPELESIFTIFGASIPYDLIRIDERAHLGPRQKRFCYVSLCTINSWGSMADPTLIHEVVHVWQYVHYGAAYIPRALYAQRTQMGYDYGGLTGLRSGNRLTDFNYEQMADVIEDGYRIANGYRAQWLPPYYGAEYLPDFYTYMRELRDRQVPAF